MHSDNFHPALANAQTRANGERMTEGADVIQVSRILIEKSGEMALLRCLVWTLLLLVFHQLDLVVLYVVSASIVLFVCQCYSYCEYSVMQVARCREVIDFLRINRTGKLTMTRIVVGIQIFRFPDVRQSMSDRFSR